MADGKFSMDYEGFLAAGSKIQAVGSALEDRYQRFLDDTEKRGEPWGEDGFGKSFSTGSQDGQGDKGYLASMRNLKDAAESNEGYIKLLQLISTNLSDTVQEIQAQDEEGADNIESAYPGGGRISPGAIGTTMLPPGDSPDRGLA